MKEQQEYFNAIQLRKREEGIELIQRDQFHQLLKLLSCPICLELFQEPVFIRECSHRFCKTCIEKSIRSSQGKKCPQCRTTIQCKRHLTRDTETESVISHIFGDVSQFILQKESSEEKILNEMSKCLSEAEKQSRDLIKTSLSQIKRKINQQQSLLYSKKQSRKQSHMRRLP